MKKLWLLGALALALASANLPAQEDAELRINAGVQTGFGVQIGNQHTAWEDYPVFTVGNWDRESLAWFQISLNRGTHGFMFNPEFWGMTRHGGAVQDSNGIFLSDAYGWFTLADDMVRISLGRFDANSVWHNFGVIDRQYSQGLGMRVEVMPIDGLNVGLFLRPTHRNVSGSIGDPITNGNMNRLSYALANTSFGARFNPAGGLFGLSAGLELRSQWELRRNFGEGWFSQHQGRPTSNNPDVVDFLLGRSRPLRNGVTNDPAPVGNPDLSNLGVSAYFGANLNLIDDLTLQFGVEAINLDDFNWSGQVWTTQRVRFDMDPLMIGMDMQQVFLAGNMSRWNWAEGFDHSGDVSHGPMDIIFRFVPHVRFDVTDDTRVQLNLPVTLAPSWSSENFNAMAFAVEPILTQQMGQGFSIQARYRLEWNNQFGIQDNANTNWWTYGEGSNSELWNRLNVTFSWNF
jgi:hypothetical protein